MKRALGWVCALALLLTAAACGQTTEPASTATTAATSVATSATRAALTMRTLQRSTEVPTTTSATKPTTAARTTAASSKTDATAATANSAASGQHSALYLPGYSADDIIRYFDEVVLSAEYPSDEDPGCVMRWESEIRYCLHGSFTQEDADWLAHVFEQLNKLDGFPGARRVMIPELANMDMYFCDRDEFHDRMYDSVPDDNADGATTYYYNGANHITDATICYWEDMSDSVRKSVLTEEVINSIGFSNDSTEREDSVVYQYGSWTNEPDDVDWVLLRLIYAQEMRAGMRRAEAERVIRKLYY
ncbi:MAG: DUF2927 domain-containing protein [Clostridia bacterium]|nr:DUF2927 domain-containing protein [Clostridia bacterium]